MVVYSGVFQYERVFNKMRMDSAFDPFILVIPDVSRGDENMFATLKLTYDTLRKTYGEFVLNSWDGERFVDYSDKADVFSSMNPYPLMTHEYYRISRLARSGKLCFYSNYGGRDINVHANVHDKLIELSYLWRYYVASLRDVEHIGICQPLLKRHKRIVASGMSKLDAMSEIPIVPRQRKRILLCPHHTVRKLPDFLSIGNFVEYASLCLSLPKRYSQLEWVFRPHPLLMWSMVNFGFWSESQREAYIKQITSYKNVVYQDSGDYYDAFVNSDAMIQDCSSFIEEYLDTGHPQCYVLRSREHELAQFTSLGEELLSHTYKAYSEQDIIDFIENVVIAGKDPMKDEREKFAKEKLMFNYPHASEAIVADIKKALSSPDEKLTLSQLNVLWCSSTRSRESEAFPGGGRRRPWRESR